MKDNIYNFETILKSAVKDVKNSKISKRNKEIIIKFHNYCLAEGLSVSRVTRYLGCLKRMCLWMKKDLEVIDKDDMVELVQKIETRDCKEYTKIIYKVTLKKFYKWINNGEYPEMVKWFKTHVKHRERKLPEELLTKEDIKKIVEKAEHPRDKALIAVLYESGCRMSEIALLKIKNISFDEYGAKLMVAGKTGMRRVRVISSAPYLSAWLGIHPDKENPDTYIWINLIRDKGKLMGYRNYVRIIKTSADKAGIKKRVNPHAFRHARATHLASHLTEAQMNQLFGWVQGSDMPATYIHLNGKDVDNALLRMHGIKEQEDKQNGNDVLKTRDCARCGLVNGATSGFCQRCGAPIDPKTIAQFSENRDNADEVMNKLVKDPEVLKLLQKKLQEMGVENG